MANRANIEDLLRLEYEEANKKYPMFASDHEGYAVLLEEVEVAIHELEIIQYHMGTMWQNIKRNQDCNENLLQVKERAIRLIEETAQVGAMCIKAMDSRKRK